MLIENMTSWCGLRLDCERESERIAARLRQAVRETLRRRGVVVALSGGIDSSVVGALCVRALGAERVFGLLLPEKDSSPETLRLSRLIVDHLGIEAEHHDITEMLETVGCYRYRDEAIRSVIPEYDGGYKCKIVLPSLLAGEHLRVFSVVVESPDGRRMQARLPVQAYLQVVAASNFKQRIRKMLEYFHADRLNYAVTGTPNRQEYDQGFFVKLGDGAADVIAAQDSATAESQGTPLGQLPPPEAEIGAEHLDGPPECLSEPERVSLPVVVVAPGCHEPSCPTRVSHCE